MQWPPAVIRVAYIVNEKKRLLAHTRNKGTIYFRYCRSTQLLSFKLSFGDEWQIGAAIRTPHDMTWQLWTAVDTKIKNEHQTSRQLSMDWWMIPMRRNDNQGYNEMSACAYVYEYVCVCLLIWFVGVFGEQAWRLCYIQLSVSRIYLAVTNCFDWLSIAPFTTCWQLDDMQQACNILSTMLC